MTILTPIADELAELLYTNIADSIIDEDLEVYPNPDLPVSTGGVGFLTWR